MYLVKFVVLISILLIIHSCSSNSAYFQTKRFTDIPTPSHTNNVEIFFSSEVDQIKKRYIKTEVIKVSVSEGKSYKQLINKLKQKGANRGVDAIIILDSTNIGKMASDEIMAEEISKIISGENIEITYSNDVEHNLYGLGIKYIENINYLSSYIKTDSVFSIVEKQRKLINLVTRDLAGDILFITGDSLHYMQMIHQYSNQHLISEQINWTSEINKKKQVIERNFHYPEIETKKSKIGYDFLSRPYQILITYKDSDDKDLIRIFYSDRTAKIRERTIHIQSTNESDMRNNYHYGKYGELTKQTIYNTLNNDSSLEITYAYYQNDDLKSLLNND